MHAAAGTISCVPGLEEVMGVNAGANRNHINVVYGALLGGIAGEAEASSASSRVQAAR